jgi:hypothetical protein
MQAPERTAPFGDQQTTGRPAVETMYQIHIRRLRPQATQRFDATQADAATAMHGHASRFVQNNYSIVFKKHAILEPLQTVLCKLWFRARALRYGRDTDIISRLQPVTRPNSPTVNPHLTRSYQAIDMCPRNALKDAQQKIVQTLTCVIELDLGRVGGRTWWLRIAVLH